ncbi:MAG: VOC family protein [Corynebacterium sp.]|nr:VOC family protein [Corynebacterium sp.]
MVKPNLYIVTLAVDDLDRSAAFYRGGLGLGAGAHGGDHVLFELQGELTLVVFLRPEFNKTAGQSNSSASDSGISLTYQADSADEVDGLLRRSVQAGGSLPSGTVKEEWGYHGYVKDPDGHLWEIAVFDE